MSYTDDDKNRGFKICESGSGVKLLQAGFEVKTSFCTQCNEHVADRDEFFFQNGAKVLSK